MINTLYHLSGSSSGVVARRDLVMRVGGFDESLLGVEDQDLWLKLAHVALVDYVPEPLVWAKWSHLTDEAVILQAFRRKAAALNRTSPFQLIHHFRVYRRLKSSKIPLARRLFPTFKSYLRCMIGKDAIGRQLYRRAKLAFAPKTARQRD
jgi:hypothetical protein